MNADDTWTSTEAEDCLALRFAAHTATLRGAVRQALVTRALLNHLPAVHLPTGRGSRDWTSAAAPACSPPNSPTPVTTSLGWTRTRTRTR